MSKFQRILQSTTAAIVLLIAVIAVVVGLMVSASHPTSHNSKIQIVAGENFWGSLVSQLGGNKVQVVSIVSDPNADPHEYESSNTDAREFASADYVVLNGAGYDSWGDKLLAASPNSKRRVLTVAGFLGKKEGDNPHFWYSPAYVNRVVTRMESDLAAIDPSDSSYFSNQLKSLNSSLAVYQSRIADIRKNFAGTKVAATEDIFAYLADASSLNLISPQAFIEAVAEGNDPPAASVVQFEQQIQSREPKILVYNQQTVTPLTTNIKALAAQEDIPVVGVTETIQPPNASFQEWMNAELIIIENALNASALGQ